MRSNNGRPATITDIERNLRSRYPVKSLSNSQLGSNNIASTSSFRYDPLGTGLRSTQEVPLDWSKFENHTFFHSAKAKVDEAFYKIINEYPFDGSQREIESFEDSLTGFESYVMGRFPYNKGYLLFSGSAGSGGNYIAVKNRAGFLFENSRDDSANPVLDPPESSFTLQTHLFIPNESNDNEIVCQRQGSGCGYTLFVSRSTSSSAEVHFLVTSGSKSLHISGSTPKNGFVHVAAALSSSNTEAFASLFFNGVRVANQQRLTDFQPIVLGSAQLLIGSGTEHTSSGFTFTPKMTLSGCLDDLRFYTRARTGEEIIEDYLSLPDFDPRLSLHFKFNEPTGSFAGNNIVLDFSGKSLHSEIVNYTTASRGLSSPLNPMLEEAIDDCIVLFSNYPDIQNLHQSFLDDAQSYDDENPNLITRLIPPQYLSLGAQSEGLNTDLQNVGQSLNLEELRGGLSQQQPQVILGLLFVYAKLFDEIKIFVDHVSNLMNFDYTASEHIADKMIPFIAKAMKIDLPDLFSTPSVKRLVKGVAISDDYVQSGLSLKKLRAQIWRRILSEHQGMLMSKGTHRSIRSAFAAMGIDPDSFFHIREFGANKGRTIVDLRHRRNKVSYFADFSGSINASPTPVNSLGFSSNIPRAISGFLSGSRVEPGSPTIQGSFVSVGNERLSNNRSDGLWTSGSFTVESRVRFLPSTSHSTTQSIIRLCTTGSSVPASTHAVTFNLMAFGGSSPYFELSARPIQSVSSAATRVRIEADPFDGGIWNLSFGKAAGETLGTELDEVFLRVSRQVGGLLTFSSASSVTFVPSDLDVLKNYSAGYNSSGSFLVIGSQSLGSSNLFLNGDSVGSYSNFTGQISSIRFWSSYLDLNEWIDHSKDFESLGVRDPRKNFNFEKNLSGSFEKLRLDTSFSQASITASIDGNFTGFDFSQSAKSFSMSGFEANERVIFTAGETVMSPSPYFDLLENDQKTRVRSLSNPQPDEVLALSSPVYQLPENEEVLDDNRLSIEYSYSANLNRDIMKAASNLDFFDDALGKPNSYFDNTYSDLDDFSRVYFNRLTSDIDLDRFSRLYRWLDGSLEVLVGQLVPAKTYFYGINQVIEPHALERSRHRFFFDDMYLNEKDRFTSSNLVLSSLFARLRGF